jgi:hypothetical protein
MKTLLLAFVAISLALPAYAQSTLYSNSTTGDVGIGTAPPQSLLHVFGGAVTDTQSIGTSSTDGIGLADPTAATSGNQQWSPRIHFTGHGWKTNSTAASQTIDVIQELQTVQGTANPSGNLVWSSQVNSGGYNPLMTLTTGGNVGVGTATPQSLVHAYGGEVQVGSSGASCTTANNGAVRYSGSTLYFCTGTAWTAVGVASGMAGGFVNKLRNGNMLVSQRLASNTSTTLSTAADAYWIDGWYYHITGANVSGYWQNAAFTTTSGNNPASIPAYAEIKGAASNTAIDIYQRIENIDASPLAGQTATVQFQFYNDSGASITPTFQTCYASALNNFATCTSDVSATNMQTCANNTTCTEAYTFNVSSSATNGYQIQFNFGAMTSTSDIIEFTGFDLRSTPSVATGLNSAPPIIEEPNYSAEIVRDQRYFISSYPPGMPGGTSYASGASYLVCFVNAGFGAAQGIRFPVTMRAAPTLNGWAQDGTANDWYDLAGGGQKAVIFGVVTAVGVGYIQVTGGNTSTGNVYIGNYQASSEL